MSFNQSPSFVVAFKHIISAISTTLIIFSLNRERIVVWAWIILLRLASGILLVLQDISLSRKPFNISSSSFILSPCKLSIFLLHHTLFVFANKYGACDECNCVLQTRINLYTIYYSAPNISSSYLSSVNLLC